MRERTWAARAAIGPTLAGVTIPGALLLMPAGLLPQGTWLWEQGIALVAAYAIISGAGNVLLATWRAEHFQIRQQSVVAAREKHQPLIDAVGSVVLLIAGSSWLLFLPVDVFSLHLLPQPTFWVSLAGGAAFLIGAVLTPLAAWENRYATPNVQQQAHQIVVRTGVYSFVRHPIYLGNLLITAGVSLWLGSYAGLWCFACLLIATVGRIIIEEKDLLARVPGYAEYAHDVRARLIPFLI